MYTVKLLPEAVNDMTEIVQYISIQLSNPAAATKLKEKIICEIKKLAENPHMYAVYEPPLLLKVKLRKMLVKNYTVFYCIDENEKTVKIARVLYAKRNFPNILK